LQPELNSIKVMNLKKTLLVVLLPLAIIGFNPVFGQSKEGLQETELNKIKEGYKNSSSDKALKNIISSGRIGQLAQNMDNAANFDTYFSNRVASKGISDQKSSGRCWMFTGLNVLRAEMIAKYNLGAFHFSQNYLFFYDQLEKANLFLSLIIKHRNEPLDSKDNEWLLKNTLSDGGQFTGVSDLVMKYGLVPSTVQPETYNSDNTSKISELITLKLKEYALELRGFDKKATTEKLTSKKIEMLSTIYRMLVLAYGEPVKEFTYTLRDASGKEISTETYTPKSFYDKYIGKNLSDSYVMLMNDPSREFYKLYEIENDRHVMDGNNWKYINLPIEDIKDIAISSIKDSTMMYFSCDVGKFYNRDKGLLDINEYDYATLFGTSFSMDKKQRIQTFASGSSHAMTLCAVDLQNNKPKKWLVENSWGASAGYQGHLIMTDEWFNEYMFRLVVDKKYCSEKILNILQQKPIILPPWDPMFLYDNAIDSLTGNQYASDTDIIMVNEDSGEDEESRVYEDESAEAWNEVSDIVAMYDYVKEQQEDQDMMEDVFYGVFEDDSQVVAYDQNNDYNTNLQISYQVINYADNNKVLYVKQTIFNKNLAWDFIYERMYSEQGKLIFFSRQFNTFNSGCTEVAFERSEYYYDKQSKLIRKTYDIYDAHNNKLEKHACSMIREDYEQYQNLLDFLSTNHLYDLINAPDGK
jgi:bleomycin hydrolase